MNFVRRVRFSWLVVCVALALGMAGLHPSPALGRDVKFSALVLDADTGTVLHAVNPDSRRYPASLTKMMTLYMVFDALERGRLRLSQRLRVSYHAYRRPPSKLGLRPGTSITVRNAILALVTKSANDVATVVAEALGGSESNFARMMTRTARRLGMNRTTFRNASGLPDPRQVTTARDMATLALALLRHFPDRYHYFSTRSFRYGRVRFRNHNRLLGRYRGVDGIKTGYIRASGYNLVASAKRNGRRVIAVVFGGRTAGERNRRMVRLLDRGFRELPPTTVVRRALPRPSLGATAGYARSSERGALWAVQVGAFKKKSAATTAARRASGLVRSLFPSATIRVELSSRGSRGRYYLARLVDTGREEAYRACRILKRNKFRCLVLRLNKRALTTVAGYDASPIVKPTAKPRLGETLAADSGLGGWGVQVGAVSKRSSALAIARQAVKTVPDPLGDGDVQVVPLALRNGGTVYRARILGIDKADAYQACRALKAKRLSCMVLRNKGLTLAASES